MNAARPPRRPDARHSRPTPPHPAPPHPAPSVAPLPQPADGAAPGAEATEGAGVRRRGAGSRPLLLYGLHAVAAAWTNPERDCRRLLGTDAGLESLAPALAEARRLGLARPDPGRVERADLDRMLPPGSVHQGVVVEAAPLPEVSVDDICAAAADRPGDVVVVLDQVTDPHNIGAILRSAAAFGASAVLVPDRHTPEVTGTLAKSASGAVEILPLVRIGNLAQCLSQLQKAGYWCVGLDEAGRRTLAELDLSGRTALVLGAEGAGLRRLTAERCDELARLPTSGSILSLNVSNAAAVALYELVRLRPGRPA